MSSRQYEPLHPLDRPARPATSRLSVREWAELCEAYGHRCAYCGRTPDVLVIEHNMPQQRGGTDTVENILPACKTCNNEKCDLSPLEWICVKAGLLRRDAKKRGVRMPGPTAVEWRRGWYYPFRPVVRVEGLNEILDCGHVRPPRPAKHTESGFDTGDSEKRRCVECGTPARWMPDGTCSCITDTTEEAVEAANRLTGAMVNGEEPAAEDIETLRNWSADKLWYRANSELLGPHHNIECAYWLAAYPKDDAGAA